GRCAAASGVPSCPLPEPHRRRPSPVPPSVSLSPVSCALPEQHRAPPPVPSADESPTSWRSLESFLHHAHTRVESARITPPWLSCPPGPPLGRLSPKRSTRYMVFSRVGPNQSIEWGQIRISKSVLSTAGGQTTRYGSNSCQVPCRKPHPETSHGPNRWCDGWRRHDRRGCSKRNVAKFNH